MLSTLILVSALAVDFGTEIGKVRPELHSSGFGPQICACPRETVDDIRSMGFKAARTHDWSLTNPSQRVCDYYMIFPLMHLDATKPENYCFGPTDHLLRRTREEAGLDVFFRLGTSIEHSKGVHFNATIPEDFDKVAETFAGTVRHYNRGWANGFAWNIRYWEIWNEPDGVDNMWCKPGETLSGWNKEVRRKNMPSFIRFFVTCLKRLKSEFGDEIKVGGPALCNFFPEYFRPLLQACRDAGVAPDFISWHYYEKDPDLMLKWVDDARALCDEMGFPKCELILDEWHFFGTYGWDDLRSPDPERCRLAWEGPHSHNGIDSSAFNLTVLSRFQTSKLDQAYYYGCSHVGDWGYKDGLMRKYNVYYSLKLFGDFVRDYPSLCSAASSGTVTLLAGRSADGVRRGLLVTDYMGGGLDLSVRVKGVPAGAIVRATVLDHERLLEPCAVEFSDGVLKLRKTRPESTAFLVTFTRPCGTADVSAGVCLADGKLSCGDPVTRIDDAFWSPRLKLWRTVTANYVLDRFEPWVGNYDRVAKGGKGGHQGPFWADGLVCETVRGLADHLRSAPDAALRARVESIAARIAAAAEKSPDGYLKTETMLEGPERRWGDNGGNWSDQHELYDIGCLVEAAVHLYRTTGNLGLLKAATRAANLCVRTFGPPPRRNLVPEHELPEEAFLKLWDLYVREPGLASRVGCEVDPDAYRALACFWLDHRGVFGRDPFRYMGGTQMQDHLPIARQETIEGHAVRAVLMGTGLAAAVRAGRGDYLPHADRLWRNMVGRKMYVTGGVGVGCKTERFASDWTLPSDGYLETCAAVGSAFWSLHMARIHDDGIYADNVERILYNALLTAVGQDGKSFTYVNPLNGDGHNRWAWHDCPCCPPMFLKLTGLLPESVWHQSGRTLFADLFIAGRTEFALPDGRRTAVKTATDYPWSGDVSFTVEADAAFALAVRIPGWARGEENPWGLYSSNLKGGWRLTVNGTPCAAEVAHGYVRIDRAWRAGDVVELKLPMAVRAITANEKVEALRGQVALARGPVVYSFERTDNPSVSNLVICADAPFRPAWNGDLSGGVMTLASGERTAIPYFAVANRERDTVFRTWVPCSDRPNARYAWRGYMLDCARHFFAVSDIKKTLDTMQMFGLNVFHWHLTDSEGWRLESERYPELTRGGPCYTKAEVREIVRSAADRGIRVIPEIDIPGHCAAAIRAYPELGCKGAEGSSELCIGKDETLKTFESILEEALDLFPDPVVHLGGDECAHGNWRRCPDCQRRIRTESLRDEKGLQSWFSVHFARFLESRGRRMLAWDDVLDAENLPKSVIVMPYRSQKNLGVEAARRGHDVVEASDAFCYLDYVQGLENDPYEYQPFGCCVSWQKISRFDPAADYPPELRGRVLGAQGNLWTELVPDFKGVEWRTWPRMAVMATVLAEGPAVDDWAFGDRMVAVVEKLKSMGVNTAPLNPRFSGKLDLESGVRCVHLRPDFARLRPHEQISTRRNPSLPSGAFVADLDWSQIEVEASDEAGFTNACRQIRRLARPKAGGVMEFPACRLECGDVPFRALPLEEMTVRRAWTNAVTGAVLDYLWHEPRHMQLGANYPLYVLRDRTHAADLLNDWRRGFFDAFLVLVPEQEDVEDLIDALVRMVRPLDRTRVIREGDCPSRSGCQGNG